MNTVWVGIIVFLVSLVVHHWIQKYWFRQPKILVSHELKSPMSNGTGDGVVMHWPGVFNLYNCTKHDALRLEFVVPPEHPAVQLRTDGVRHVEALDTVQVWHQTFTRKVVTEHFEANRDRWVSSLQPEEMKNLSFTLWYENDMGNRFNTVYEIVDGVERSRHKRWAIWKLLPSS